MAKIFIHFCQGENIYFPAGMGERLREAYFRGEFEIQAYLQQRLRQTRFIFFLLYLL